MGMGRKEEEAICSLCCKMASVLLKSDVMRAADEHSFIRSISIIIAAQRVPLVRTNLTLLIPFDFQCDYTFFMVIVY